MKANKINTSERLTALRAADARVARLIASARRYRLTVRKFERDRDGVRLVLARRGSGGRGGKLVCQRVFFLGEPYTVAQYDRLAALPAE